MSDIVKQWWEVVVNSILRDPMQSVSETPGWRGPVVCCQVWIVWHTLSTQPNSLWSESLHPAQGHVIISVLCFWLFHNAICGDWNACGITAIISMKLQPHLIRNISNARLIGRITTHPNLVSWCRLWKHWDNRPCNIMNSMTFCGFCSKGRKTSS